MTHFVCVKFYFTLTRFTSAVPYALDKYDSDGRDTIEVEAISWN